MKYVYADVGEAIRNEPVVSDRHKWRLYECVLCDHQAYVWERSPSLALGRAAECWGAIATPVKTDITASTIEAAFGRLSPAQQAAVLRRLGKTPNRH